MSGFLGKRAVVVGAGMAGLSAAGALARHFEQVDVFERDQLAPAAASRAGTPQDRHPHGLLAGGLEALETLFPGFAGDLAGAGAVRVAVAQDVRYERPEVGCLPRRAFDLSVLCASRPLIELVLRRRVQAIANVALRPGCRVAAIVPAGDAVHGVQVEMREGGAETLAADLVVDASGRGTLTLALLEALDRQQPEVSEVGVDLSYASATVRIPADAPDWKLLLTFPDAPAAALHGVLLPVEGDRWMVLIADHGQTARPQSWDQFLAQSRGLITPTLHDTLRRVEPPAGMRHYGFPASQWRHFERLPGLPRGVLPIGDALCRFNPIYGQGMSVAAQQACLLRDVLGRAAAGRDALMATQAAFMAEVSGVLQTPWAMSTSADLAFPATRGQRPENFAESRQFEAALFRTAAADPVVHRTLLEVSMLLRPFGALQEPEIMQRVEAVCGAPAA